MFSLKDDLRQSAERLVQLQACYHHCGEAASEKCLSTATVVRRQIASSWPPNNRRRVYHELSATRAVRSPPGSTSSANTSTVVASTLRALHPAAAMTNVDPYVVYFGQATAGRTVPPSMARPPHLIRTGMDRSNVPLPAVRTNRRFAASTGASSKSYVSPIPICCRAGRSVA